MENIINQLKQQKLFATKSKDKELNEFLSFVIGEIETAQSRKGWKEGHESKILKKILDGINESAQHSHDMAFLAKCKKEGDFIARLLPRELSVREIESELMNIMPEISLAKSEGQALGVAMKHCKSKGLTVSPKDVKVVVEKMRDR